jgi:predicted AlkP superfamily phosphohydrolase/phosphomutase
MPARRPFVAAALEEGLGTVESMSSDHRVIVLGLDCLAPQLVYERWRDRLPNFSRLIQGGRCGLLRSTDPPITVPAWTSIATGKDPGELGCYGFRNRNDYSYDGMALADATTVRETPLWHMVSRHRKRSIVLGVPQTYPPQPLRGVLVSGLLTPDEDAVFTYPADFRRQLDRITGGYRIDVRGFRTEDKAGLLGEIHEMTRRRFRALRHLVVHEEWDFLMAVEMGPDRMHHAFWKDFDERHPLHRKAGPYADAVPDYYRLLDEELGVLLGLLDNGDTLLVVSDHGAQPMQGGVCMNEWLRRRGYLRLHHTPRRPAGSAVSAVDWSNTTAWADGGYYARIFLNVRGREPNGAVPPEDYRAVREDLALALQEMRGPDGIFPGNRVLRPEQTYRACRGIPPDLMVYLGDLGWRSLRTVGGEVFTQGNDTGPDDANHDIFGVFMLYEPWRGEGGRKIDNVYTLDLAPTVLDRLGIPIPPDMRGRTLAPL